MELIGNNMSTLDIGFFCLIIMIIMAMIWNFYCNEKTYKDRMKIIQSMQSAPSHTEFLRLVELYQMVPYDAHLLHLMLLRDPMTLYSPDIQQMVNTNKNT